MEPKLWVIVTRADESGIFRARLLNASDHDLRDVVLGVKTYLERTDELVCIASAERTIATVASGTTVVIAEGLRPVDDLYVAVNLQFREGALRAWGRVAIALDRLVSHAAEQLESGEYGWRLPVGLTVR
jgi:hypothetical protein